MAIVEQLTIEFSGKGAPKLTGQLNALSAAMNRLAARQVELKKKTEDGHKGNEEYSKGFRSFERNAMLGDGALARFGKTMSRTRSRLLIIAFTFGLVTKALGTLMKAFSEYEKLNFKINAILKSTGLTAGVTARKLDQMAQKMEKTMNVTSTAVKEMQARLLTFTNIAMPVFEQAQEAAADMAAVFGQDLAQATIQLGKALNDPMKGYTALRRIGVSFSAEQVNLIKKFQEQGDIMSAQQVILDELNKEFGGAAEAITKASYAAESFRTLGNETAEMLRNWGQVLEPLIFLLGELGRGLIEIINVIPNLLIKTGELIGNFFALATGAKQFSESVDFQKAFGSQLTFMNKQLNQLKDNFLAAATDIDRGFTPADKLKEISDEIDELTLSQKARGQVSGENEKIQERIDVLLEEYAKKMGRNNALIAGQIVLQTKEQELIAKSEKKLKIKMELLQKEFELGRKLTVEEKTKIEQQRELTETEKEYADAIEETNKKLAGRVAMKEAITDFFQEVSSKTIESSRAEQAAIKDKVADEIATLRESFSYQRANDKKKKEMEADVKKRHQKDMQDAFKQEKRARYLEVVMNAHAGASRAFKDYAYPASAVVAGLVILQAMMNASAISELSAPKLRYGGLIGGSSHSQGGTMIEAERGEFVMRREAVEAVGIETMNRINAGGGGGSVNISFNGNVLTKDFIEDEAIPQIKEAIRRGADIGVG